MKTLINNDRQIPRILVLAAVAALTLTVEASAQAPARRIDSIRTMAADRGPYRVEIEGSRIVLIDRDTRLHLATASLESDENITLSGRVGTIARRDREVIDQIATSADAFNLGYRVARLELDRATGVLMLEQSVPADGVSSGELATAIVRFGDLVHEERSKLEQALRAASHYCPVTCRPSAEGESAYGR